MRFYTQQHKHYCGIDLHARMMYLCVLDGAGAVLLSRNTECTPKAFLAAVKAYHDARISPTTLRPRSHPGAQA
jgi:hypothetical protein